MTSVPMINIAIDGYSSCGKSTLARALAAELGYRYIDSGAMYRAVTLFAIQSGLFRGSELDTQALVNKLPGISIRFVTDADGQSQTCLDGKNVEQMIREPRVSDCVSEVSRVPEVRQFLVQQQREMGREKGVVMDGRDIGSVVFPDAELKLFVTARPEIRTQRRYDELKAKGIDISPEEVRENLEKRDHIDTHRAADPLRQAEDAILLDNSSLNREQQLARALDWFHQKTHPLNASTNKRINE